MDINKRRIIKTVLFVYIILCVLIAGLNYGYAPNADEATQHLIENVWHFYENGFKMIMILIIAYLSFSIIRKEKKYAHRRRNMMGLIITAFILHVVLPLIVGVSDFYFFSMPAPFTNMGLQLLNKSSVYYQSKLPVWGSGTISLIVILFVVYSLCIYIGTYFFGRQLQCSTLCLFNGFIGEIFSPIFSNKRKPYGFLKYFRVIFFVLGILFTGYWLFRIVQPGSFSLLERFENFKYLIGELFVAMFLWISFTGRGYCYYCPLGTTLSHVAKLGHMRIDTTENECINCGRCNKVCPMNIDIRQAALQKLPLTHSLCVGCGHCVDACPTSTLIYRTKKKS